MLFGARVAGTCGFGIPSTTPLKDTFGTSKALRLLADLEGVSVCQSPAARWCSPKFSSRSRAASRLQKEGVGIVFCLQEDKASTGAAGIFGLPHLLTS